MIKYINNFPTANEIPGFVDAPIKAEQRWVEYSAYYWLIEYLRDIREMTIVEITATTPGNWVTMETMIGSEVLEEDDFAHPFMILGPIDVPTEVASWAEMEEVPTLSDAWGTVTRTYNNGEYSCYVARGARRTDVLMTLTDTETKEVLLITSNISERDQYVILNGWVEDPTQEEWR